MESPIPNSQRDDLTEEPSFFEKFFSPKVENSTVKNEKPEESSFFEKFFSPRVENSTVEDKKPGGEESKSLLKTETIKLKIRKAIFPLELFFAYFFFHFLLLKALCLPFINLAQSLRQTRMPTFPIYK